MSCRSTCPWYVFTLAESSFPSLFEDLRKLWKWGQHMAKFTALPFNQHPFRVMFCSGMQLLGTPLYFYKDSQLLPGRAVILLRCWGEARPRELIIYHNRYKHLSHIIPFRETSLCFYKYLVSHLSQRFTFPLLHCKEKEHYWKTLRHVW